MRTRRVWNAAVSLALCAALGCGTILYPERRGQRAGELDVGVALLDAVGLLIFFVPGVVAFAVDFSTGAIYLPRGQRSKLLNLSGPDRSGALELERIPLAERSLEAVEASLRERGIEVDLRTQALRIGRGVTEAELPALLESLNREAAYPQFASR
jgi:hypothetical protein